MTNTRSGLKKTDSTFFSNSVKERVFSDFLLINEYQNIKEKGEMHITLS